VKQVNVIDSLRSFAALSVCMYHFICTTTGLVFPKTVFNIFYYGQYGVFVFFIISGFIIPWSMYQNNYKLNSVLKFIAKRFIRLEPPYIVSIILILTIIFIKSKFHLGIDQIGELNAKRIGLHFGYLINFFPQYKWLNNVYWTLAIEFQYYLVMALMFVLYVNKKLFVRIMAYLLCFAMAYMIPDPGLNHYPGYAPLFLFGISIFQYKAKIINHIECIIVITACFIYNYAFINHAFAYCGLGTAAIILWFSEIKVAGLNWLGKMSYSIYLIHPIVGAAVINLLCKYATGTIQKTLIIFVGLIVTFISSFIMYLLVEKPSKKLSSKIKL